MNIEFTYKLDQRIITPFGKEGIITMLGFDEGGKMYYVKTEISSNWHKEGELSYIPTKKE